METGKLQKKITLSFINEKSPIIDIICNDLSDLGFEILFRSEHIEEGTIQLSALTSLPEVCIIDLDFYDKNVLADLLKLHKKYPDMKLIAHSDIFDEKTAKVVLDLGFSGYLLVGSDVDDFKRVIEKVMNGKSTSLST